MNRLVIGLLVGAAAGFAVALLLQPHLAAPGAVSEKALDPAAREIRATGTFVHVVPSDPARYGAGSVSVFADGVQLGGDFAVGPGPKYHLYLVPRVGIDADTRVEETMFVDLGPLKGFSGEQNYPLPTGVDPGDFGSVVVWCEQFNELIAPAELVFKP